MSVPRCRSLNGNQEDYRRDAGALLVLGTIQGGPVELAGFIQIRHRVAAISIDLANKDSRRLAEAVKIWQKIYLDKVAKGS